MSEEKFLSLGHTFLRYSLGIVFLWFGLLKLFGVSPVLELIAEVYPFMAKEPIFYAALAWSEVVLGVAIMLPKISPYAALLIAFHLIGATAGVLFDPMAFEGGFPRLSIEGEFVVKNVVLIAGALVVAGSAFSRKKLLFSEEKK